MCINSKLIDSFKVISNNAGSNKKGSGKDWQYFGTHLFIPNNKNAIIYAVRSWNVGKPYGLLISESSEDPFYGMVTAEYNLGGTTNDNSISRITSTVIAPYSGMTYYLWSCSENESFVTGEAMVAFLFPK